MKIRINLKNIMKSIFCFVIGLYSSFYYFNYGFPQVYLLIVCLIMLILSVPDIKTLFLQGNLVNIFLILILAIGLFIGQFNSTGVNYLITLVVLLVISDICRKDYILLKKLYHTVFAFSVISVLLIYFEFLFPETFFALAENLLSVGSYSTLVHIYSVSGAYGGLSGYSSLAAFSCAVMCGCTFSAIFSSTREITKTGRMLNIIGFVAAFFAIILTTKRSLFAAILIAAILVFVFTKNLNRTAKYGMFFLAVIGLFILLYSVRDNENFISFLQRFKYTNNNDFTSGRTDIIALARNYLGSRWIIGIGTGMGALFANSIAIGGGLHNIYFQILFENGIFGFALWMVFFIMNLKNTLRYRYDSSRPYVMVSLFIQIIFLIYGFFGNPLYEVCILCSYILSITLPIYREES